MRPYQNSPFFFNFHLLAKLAVLTSISIPSAMTVAYENTLYHLQPKAFLLHMRTEKYINIHINIQYSHGTKMPLKYSLKILAHRLFFSICSIDIGNQKCDISPPLQYSQFSNYLFLSKSFHSSAHTFKTVIPIAEGDSILKLLQRVSRPEIQLGVGIHSE